jgi:rhamnosyltransferase
VIPPVPKVVTTPIYVLLATYNGSAFIAEQLDSLIAQTEPGWHLLVRDDASTDRTPEIVAAYAARDGRISVLPASESNQGSTANFDRLLRAACERGAAYAMLMDQDDVWRADKIERQTALMRDEEARLGSGVPILVHSDLELIDRDGRTLRRSFMSFQHIRDEPSAPLRTVLVQNYVTGCTILANRALLDVALPIPPAAMVHDWWLALVAAAVGAIRYDATPTVGYRQHRGNQIGAKRWRRGAASVWRALRLSRTGRGDFARSLAQAGALKVRVERAALATDAQRELLAVYCALFEGPRSRCERIKGLRALGLRRQWAVRQWLLYLHACLMPAAYPKPAAGK